MPKSKKDIGVIGTRYLSFVLEFVGSMIFLWLVSSSLGGISIYSNSQQFGIFLPLVYGLAVVSSVALFFVSFINFTNMRKLAGHAAMKSALTAGVTIIALTILGGSTTAYYYAFGAFIIAFIGSGLSYDMS